MKGTTSISDEEEDE